MLVFQIPVDVGFASQSSGVVFSTFRSFISTTPRDPSSTRPLGSPLPINQATAPCCEAPRVMLKPLLRASWISSQSVLWGRRPAGMAIPATPFLQWVSAADPVADFKNGAFRFSDGHGDMVVTFCQGQTDRFTRFSCRCSQQARKSTLSAAIFGASILCFTVWQNRRGPGFLTCQYTRLPRWLRRC